MAKKYHVVTIGSKTGIFLNNKHADKYCTDTQNGGRKGYNNLDLAKQFYVKGCGGKIADVPIYDKKGKLISAQIIENPTVNTQTHVINDGKTCRIYVDGSFNEQRGSGIGLVILDSKGEETTVSEKLNNKFLKYGNIGAECMASLVAMEWAVRQNYDTVNIFYDCECINSYSKDIGKKPTALKKEYYNRYQEYAKKIKINFIHTKAHKNNRLNNKADLLAKLAIA